MSAKDKDFLYVDEPYTCSVCGRKNLKFEDIVWKKQESGQIDKSTVTCKVCGLLSLWPSFKNMVKVGCEKEAEKLFKKMIKEFEHNYDRRLLRRVLKKKRGEA